jgi:hypothetical protein
MQADNITHVKVDILQADWQEKLIPNKQVNETKKANRRKFKHRIQQSYPFQAKKENLPNKKLVQVQSWIIKKLKKGGTNLGLESGRIVTNWRIVFLILKTARIILNSNNLLIDL